MLKSRHWILLLGYTLSGLISLSYEVLWARMLSLQFGVSIFGVVVTVTAFMLGLGLGSLAGTKLLSRCSRPLYLFAWLEAAIAVYALLLPLIFRSSDGWLTLLAADAGVGLWLTLQALALLVLMLLPALAMGLAFPLILRSLNHVAGSLPLLYGLNAVGGAIGALLPLLLLPNVGWTLSVRLTAMLGLFVAVLVMWQARIFDRRFNTGTDGNRVGAGGHGVAVDTLQWPALYCYGGIGAAALMLEIGWTRLFGMVMLRTEYVLAVILAVFLLGIGSGSLLARYLHGSRWLMILPCCAALFAAVTLWALVPVSAWIEQAQFASLLSALLAQGGVLMVVTLPVTIVFGAWLPLLARQASGAGPDHVAAGARLYGVNSVGAALGSLLAGFVLVPWLGTTSMMVVAVVLLFACGLYWAPQRRIAWFILPVLLILWPVRDFPPVAELLPQTQAGSDDIYRYEDAVSITHVVEQTSGQRLLLSDLQRMDASSDPDAVTLQQNQARLPLLLHGHPGSVLFLGLGTGITASGSLPFDGIERTAVELSQGAITAAADWFADVNGHVLDSMRVIHHDGRQYLRSSRQSFDVIIGDVFHPDMAGRSALLSVQQFQRARARLQDNGWFVQWLALNQFDIDALRVVIRSFQQVFPHMRVFVDGFRLALAGSNNPEADADGAAGQAQIMQRLLHSLGADQARRATGGEGVWTWLGRYWGRPVVGDGVVQNEWSPQIEFSLPLARYRGDIDVARLMDWLLQQRPSPQQAAKELGVANNDYRDFERAYIGSGLALRSWLARLQGHQAEANRLIRFAYQANPHDRWAGLTLADDMLATLPQALQRGMDQRQALQAIIDVRPDHIEALRALWHLAEQRGDQVAAQTYLQRLHRLSPLDREARDRVH